MIPGRPHRDPGRKPVIKGVDQTEPTPSSSGVVFIEHASREVDREPEPDPVRLNVSLSTRQP